MTTAAKTDDTIRMSVRVSPTGMLIALAIGLAAIVLGLTVRTLALKAASDEGSDLPTLTSRVDETRKELWHVQKKWGNELRRQNAIGEFNYNRIIERIDRIEMLRATEEPDEDATWLIRTVTDGDRRGYRCKSYKQLAAGDHFALLELDFGDDAKVIIRCEWYEATTPCPKFEDVESDGDPAPSYPPEA